MNVSGLRRRCNQKNFLKENQHLTNTERSQTNGNKQSNHTAGSRLILQSSFVYEKTAIKVIVHERGIAKRRRTKCGKMSRRQSERFDSTVEVGELEPYEESVEGSESSEHWLAFGQPIGGVELCER